MNMHVKPPKIKAGDTVKVIDAGGGHDLPLGATDKVQSVEHGWNRNDDLIRLESGGSAYAYRFELVTDPDLKVGTKLRAMDSIDSDYFTPGNVYEIGKLAESLFVITDNEVRDPARAKHHSNREWLLENFEVNPEPKVGDRVRGKCVYGATKTTEGVIEDMDSSSIPYYVRRDAGDCAWLYRDGIELLPSTAPAAAPATTYKVGDYVRATKDGFDLTKGVVYKVKMTDVPWPAEGRVIGILDDADDLHFLRPDEFEKFEFRVGDRVKFCGFSLGDNGSFAGKTGTLHSKPIHHWVVLLDERHSWGHSCGARVPPGMGRFADADDLEPLLGKAGLAAAKFKVGDRVLHHNTARPRKQGQAIVCKIEDGKVKPATRPFVHDTAALAGVEAERLARTKGGSFGVYELVAVAFA